MFYMDGIAWPLAFRAVYSSVYRVAYICIICVFMVGCVFEYENVYRSIVEWRGFTWISRISYGAFLLHSIVQRGLVGVTKCPIYFNDYFSVIFLNATLFTSNTCGVMLYLFVEAPTTALVKAILTPSRKEIRQRPDAFLDK